MFLFRFESKKIVEATSLIRQRRLELKIHLASSPAHNESLSKYPDVICGKNFTASQIIWRHAAS